MIKIENTEVYGWEAAIRGMRNPMNSWGKSDSGFCGGENHIGCLHCTKTTRESVETQVKNDAMLGFATCPCEKKDFDGSFEVGKNDMELMKKLVSAGSDHSKFMRMITVTCDITANHTIWSEIDTYKVGTVRNSCSKMHMIHAKPFELADFDCEAIKEIGGGFFSSYVKHIEFLEHLRNEFNKTHDFLYWRALVDSLPLGLRLRSTLQLNYAVLRNMYHARKNHKLQEWHDFCHWIKSLPYSELITGGKENEN